MEKRMNILKQIKLLILGKKEFDKIKEAYMENTTSMKPGWQTTEFWLTVITSLTSIVGALKGVVSTETATTAVVVLNSIYGVMRGLQKNPEITTLVKNN